MGELAGGKLGHIDLVHLQQPAVEVGTQIHVHLGKASEQQRGILIEQEDGRRLAPPQRGQDVVHREERFARTRRGHEQHAGAAHQAAG